MPTVKRPLTAWLLVVIALLGCPHPTSVRGAETTDELTLSSPDGCLVLQFALGRFGEDQSCPYYALSFNGRSVVAPSRLGLELEGGSFLTNLVMTGHQRETRDTIWQPVAGERRETRDHYHQLEVDLCQADNPQRRLRLTFRAYNEGAALRFTRPRQVGMASATLQRKRTEFRFAGDHTTWVTTSAQGEYRRTTLNQLPPGTERPLLIQANESLSLALAEARLIDYPNLMTMEGIRGDEARPSAEQTLITLFTRMLAGPADNTVCYTDRRVAELWTHSFQLAKAVCLYSPWQFLFPSVPTPTRVRVESRPATAGGSLTIPLIANSGAAFHLVPTAPSQVQPPN